METHIYTTPTSVICIDEETGKAIWQLTTKQIAALREAGEKMAEVLKFIQLQNDAAHLESAGLWSVNGETEIQVAEAREAWEAANK